MKKFPALLLTIIMAVSITATASAASARFKDVPSNFWAYEYIEALAEGGLVGGYGSGYFGPNDTLNIDHMAQIICNAKGYYVDSGSSYWAHDEVKYCIEELYCLPNMGEVTSANYSVPCSRELAVYMMTIALGSSGKVQADYSITAKDIPDYARINPAYAPTVLKAYQLGLIAGVDANRTFNPKANLTRAQACTVLNRAGFTKAAPKPTTSNTTGMTAEQMYNEMVTWGTWEESSDGNGTKCLIAKDRKYGGVMVEFLTKGSVLITMPEKNYDGITNENGQFVDVNGSVLAQEMHARGYKDVNGKVVVSSGWSYDARQLVKKVLALAFPTGSAEAYDGIISVMKQECYEIPKNPLPSVLRWLEGRTYSISMNQGNHYIRVSIDKIGNERSYSSALSGTPANHGYYSSMFGGIDVTKYFELSRG